MADNKLPLRFRILDYMASQEYVTVDSLLSGLRPEYGAEKHFRRPEVLEHLLSIVANGLATEVGEELGTDGKLLVHYAINDEGKRLLKNYLPKWWKST